MSEGILHCVQDDIAGLGLLFRLFRMTKMSLLARIILVLFLAGIVFAFVSAWREWGRSKRVEAEVDKLRAQAAQIGQENQSLTERIAYFSTSGYQEKEAKEKLGLKNADETAVVIEPGATSGSAVAPVPTDEPMAAAGTSPNWRKWWNHFFKRS